MELQNKINNSIKIIKLAAKEAEKYNEPLEVCYSGGKDSDIILQLAKMAEVNFVAIYKNTTIDPPGTKKHVLENGVTIKNPQTNFFDLIKKKGFPSFTRRFCCQVLKEYKIYNVAILGIRRDESQKRRKRYKSFEECRIYNKKERVRQYYPILDWSLLDVKNFIQLYNIKLAPIYYDQNGNIDFNRRLGCQGCPLATDRGKKDFKENKKILIAWLKAGAVYTATHKTRYTNVYDAFVNLLFYKNYSSFKEAQTGIFKEYNINSKQVIETYFGIKIEDNTG